MTREGRLFVFSILAFAAVGAVLILATASQFSETPASVWVLVVSALLAAIFAVGMLRWRPPTTT